MIIPFYAKNVCFKLNMRTFLVKRFQRESQDLDFIHSDLRKGIYLRYFMFDVMCSLFTVNSVSYFPAIL